MVILADLNEAQRKARKGRKDGVMGSVRLGKVVYSSGCESRSSKEGQPLDREPWVGGSNSKD